MRAVATVLVTAGSHIQMAVKLVQQQTQDSRSAAEICLSDVAHAVS